MSKPRRVALTPAVGPGIGIGHIRRCRGIAEWLSGRGWHVSWLPIPVGGDEDTFQEDWARSVESESGALDLWIIDASVMDPHRIAERLTEVRGSSGTPMCIIDTGTVTALSAQLPAGMVPDLIIVPHGEPGRSRIGGTRRGLGYSIFPPQLYLAASRRSLGVPRLARRVLVTTGGVDGAGIAAFFVDCLKRITQVDLHVSVLVGPDFAPSYTKHLQEQAHTSMHGWEFIQGADSAVSHSSDAHLALCSGGLTKLELAAVGLPTVIVDESDAHGRDSRLLARLGAAYSLGTLGRIGLHESAAEIQGVLGNPFSRRQVSSAGRRLFTRGDAEATIKEIEETCQL